MSNCPKPGSAAEVASSTTHREPYAGISQSILLRLLADPSHPRATRNRKIIHRLFVIGWITVGVGFLVIVASMIAALAGV